MSSNGNGNSGIEEAPVIFTTDEEGAEHRFQMIDMIEVEGRQYGLLLYLGQEEETETPPEGYDEEVVVMRIIEEDGEQVFEAIEDEAEFDKVVAYVEQMEDDDEDEDGAEEEEEEPFINN